MWLDTNLYSWTYQVAKWAWEADLEPEAVLEAAAAIVDATSPALGDGVAAATAAAIVEQMSAVMADVSADVSADVTADTPMAEQTGAPTRDVFAFPSAAESPVGGLLERLPAINRNGADDVSEAASVVVAALTLGAAVVAASLPDRDKVNDKASERVDDKAHGKAHDKLLDQGDARASSTPVLPARVTPPAAPRGKWVLKGYETRIAFSLHVDPHRQALRQMANEPSTQDTHDKYLQRRGPRGPAATVSRPTERNEHAERADPSATADTIARHPGEPD